MTLLDSINGWSIQTLLRGENDSKQLDEFQAMTFVLVIIFHVSFIRRSVVVRFLAYHVEESRAGM